MSALDPVDIGPALARVAGAVAMRPLEMATSWVKFAGQLTQASTAAALRATGRKVDGPVKPDPKDKRFADPAWETNAWFWLTRQSHLLVEKLAAELVDSAPVDEQTRRKAAFAIRLLVDAAAPTNTLLGNPAALKHALDTGGLSLVRGASNLLADFAENRGQPRQVKPGAHKVGKDLAVTPGQVVFRNNLMELIQYAPQTETTFATPILFSPPWINKYYIMDLAPGRSLVEWAVKHGHTVFTISYRNPDASMRDVRLDDYLISGPRQALDIVTDITGSEEVNLLGLCLGGTLTMALLSYLDATGDHRVRSATLLNTLVDFSEPGPLGLFTDESTVSSLEQQMERTGFLSADSMRLTFDLLRDNDLVWNYVVNNWLMGEDPPAFDILTWNGDSTRMPARMHSFYLRSCYLDNELARGVMELAGQRLDPASVNQDLYFVAAEQDHIAPWKSVYKGALVNKSDVRFVLSNSGHIAGIVNPPSPKSKHWVSEGTELPRDPDVWRAEARENSKTWWEDWLPWIAERSGEQQAPPPMGDDDHPALGPAPGTYVMES